MGYYSIKDLEKLSGVKAHTIRIWEQRYQLIKPHRTETNIRYYNDEQLKLLLNVSLLLKAGLKISKVSELKTSQLHDKIDALYNSSNYDAALDDKINGLLNAMIELDEPRFEKIFSSVVLRIGFEEAMLQLIYPFLEKVGMMWGINKVNPAQEHFISCLIRQKTIAAIDGQLHKENKNQKFLLFLPENEFHELGLLMAQYLLRNWGFKVYYLGQNVPLVDVVEIYKNIKPENIITFFISPKAANKPDDYLQLLKKNFPQAIIYYAGRADLISTCKPLPQTIKLNSFVELKQKIAAV